MKIKNIAAGDFVQVKKSMCHSEFKAKQVCEVIDIDPTDKYGFDVLIQGKNCLDWVNHKDLKKYIEREPEPQLKQLDQSVFDGLEENWRFAAVDGCTGRAYVYEQNPHFFHGKDYWRIHEGLQRIIGHDYDASNWRDSLIERDIAKELLEIDLSSELTGSDLARAMLARGDKYVMCLVSDSSQEDTLLDGYSAAISSITYNECFYGYDFTWLYATPINNQGEPLTASEVGL